MPTKKKTDTTALAEQQQIESAIAAQFGGADTYQIPTDAPLPRAVIMRESGQFEMPGGELLKTFEGHILFWHEANTYWAHAFGEGDTSFPDCCSSNGAFPDGGGNRQHNSCATCAWNQYGTDPKGGRGKGCQNANLRPPGCGPDELIFGRTRRNDGVLMAAVKMSAISFWP